MNLLVTGGNGFIGHELVKKLKSLKHNVTVIDNLSYERKVIEYSHDIPGGFELPDPYPEFLKEDNIEGVFYIKRNVLEIEEICQGGKFDICFHLAALSRIQPSFTNPKSFFVNNVCTTQAVCDWAKNNNVKVVYSGSSSQWQDPFLSPYACYKKMGEDIIKLYRKIYNCNFEIARFYNVYGKGELTVGKWAAVIGKWHGRAIRDYPLEIVGDGTQKRDFTHVDDIVDGLIRIALSHQKHEDAWELGSGFEYTINEVAQMFVKQFDCKVQYIDNQKGNYTQSRRSNDDAITRLGWKPKDRLKKYIKNL